MKSHFIQRYMVLLFAVLQVDAFDPKALFPKLDLPFSQLISPPSKINTKDLLLELEDLIDQSPRNGIDTPQEIGDEIIRLCVQLEACNPTPRPITSSINDDDMPAVNGFWKMRWTNFSPAAPSSGQLGPLVGDVYQSINLPPLTPMSSAGDSTDDDTFAKNILKIEFPPIVGTLVASPAVVNDSTMSIAFESVGNILAGFLPLGPSIQFEKNKEIRVWEHVYVDQNYRILYARRQETDPQEDRGFLYIMKRAEDERFD